MDWELLFIHKHDTGITDGFDHVETADKKLNFDDDDTSFTMRRLI